MSATFRQAIRRHELWAASVLSLVSRLGRTSLDLLGGVAYIVAIIWTSLLLAIRRETWTRDVRTVFARQILFTGVDGLGVALRIGIAVGILLIVEAAMWLDYLGTTTDVMAPLLLAITVRELGPLIANLIVIGRSGAAISTELANMKVRGELHVLESQGIDVMTYLVMPRILSVMVSVYSLAVVLVFWVFVSGYLVGLVAQAIHTSPWEFFQVILAATRPADLLFFFPKTIITGCFVGAICCWEGLRVRPVVTEVPRVASRSGVRALTAVFIVNAVLSLIIYGRLLVFQVL